MQCFDAPSQYQSAILPINQHLLLMAGSAELVDLAETEGTSRKPRKPSLAKAIEFSPQVTQFFNIIGFLEILRSFYGTFRGEIEDF